MDRSDAIATAHRELVERRDELYRLLPEWERRGQERFEAGDPEFTERFEAWEALLHEYEHLCRAIGCG